MGMKLIISTVVGFVVLFLLGWLFYGMLFMNYFAEGYSNIARSPESMRMWAIIVANLVQALLISLIYSKFFNKGGSPVGQGMTCGIWLGLFSTVPYIFYMYASMAIANWQVLVVDGLVGGFMIVITSIAIAFVYGGKKEQAPA
jgi:hypothetical protein